jgi:hypothetical protein
MASINLYSVFLFHPFLRQDRIDVHIDGDEVAGK